MKRYPQHDPDDSAHRERLAEAAHQAMLRRERERKRLEMADLHLSRTEIEAVIDAHQRGVDEVMRGRT